MIHPTKERQAAWIDRCEGVLARLFVNDPREGLDSTWIGTAIRIHPYFAVSVNTPTLEKNVDRIFFHLSKTEVQAKIISKTLLKDNLVLLELPRNLSAPSNQQYPTLKNLVSSDHKLLISLTHTCDVGSWVSLSKSDLAEQAFTNKNLIGSPIFLEENGNLVGIVNRDKDQSASFLAFKDEHIDEIEKHIKDYSEAIKLINHSQKTLSKELLNHSLSLLDQSAADYDHRYFFELPPYSAYPESKNQLFDEPTTYQSTFGLHQIINEFPQSTAFILLGLPGSGKTTCLKHSAVNINNLNTNKQQATNSESKEITHSTEMKYPAYALFFSIRLYAAQLRYEHHDTPPFYWLKEQWQKIYSPIKLETLLTEGCWLHLDGLDDLLVGCQDKQLSSMTEWLNLIRELQENYPKSKIIFSSREQDYHPALFQDSKSQEMLLIPQIHLRAKQNQHSAKKDSLNNSFFDTQNENFIFHEDQQKQPTRQENILFQLLTALGSILHKKNIERSKSCRKIKFLTTNEIQKNISECINNENLYQILSTGAHEKILTTVDIPNQQNEKLWGFRNNYHQEFFAGFAIAFSFKNGENLEQWLPAPTQWKCSQRESKLDIVKRDIHPEEGLPILQDSLWTETFKKATDILFKQNCPTEKIEEFINRLMKVDLCIASDSIHPYIHRLSINFKEKLINELVFRTQQKSADIRARYKAGIALGYIGDPRIPVSTKGSSAWVKPGMVEIPEGHYTLGVKESTNDEHMEYTADIKAFSIGKFPITNFEWSLFINDGGYENPDYWPSEESKQWQEGTLINQQEYDWWINIRQSLENDFEGTLEELSDLDDTYLERIKDWMSWPEASVESWLREQCLSPSSKHPLSMQSYKFHHPTQPVVGVSWFEAQAYCLWLSSKNHCQYNLPTETQWEAASRGKLRRLFPWGLRWTNTYANTHESHWRTTSPVGIYAEGRCPGRNSIYDMSGNCWEWTRSNFSDADMKASHLKEILLDRAIRGGAWNFDYLHTTTTTRKSFFPGYRSFSVGFRVISEKQ